MINGGQALTGFFERIAASSTNSQVREEALRYVALMRLHSGNIADANKAWDQLGLIRSWTVLGPFAGEAPAGGQVEPGVDYTAGGVTHSWRSAPAIGPRGTLDISHLFPGVNSGTIAVAAVVTSDSSRMALLKVGAASGVKVFVNGDQVLDEAESQFAFDEYAAMVHLNAGTNRIVIALRKSGTSGLNAGQDWLLSARLSSAQDPDLLAEAEEAANAQPDATDALDTLAGMQLIRGRLAAHDTFDLAARMSPSAEHWLRAAGSCAGSMCAYAALSTAQSLEPNNAAVLTQLAQYYASRRQTQKSLELLKRASSAAPDDFAPAALSADALAALGQKAEALGALRAVEKKFGAIPWLQVQLAQRYERLGMLEDAVRLDQAALAQDFDNVDVRAALQRLYSRSDNGERLRAFYADSLKLDPTDTKTLADMSQLDAGAGRLAAAKAELTSAIAIAPDDVRLREQLADILSGAGQQSEAAVVLTRAIAAHPADDSLRQRALLQGDATLPENPEKQYTVDASALAAQTRTASPVNHADAVGLADIRVVHLEQDGAATVRDQQVVYIADESGARDYSTRTITYAPRSQSFHVVHARVFHANGDVIPAEDLGDSGPGDSSASMYYDTRTRTLRFPALAPGDVIELDYRLTPKNNPYGDYFSELETFGGSTPTHLQRYVVIAPASRPLHITAERLSAARESSTATENTYAWEVRNMAPLPSEPHGPATTEIAPYVSVSTLDSWAEVGRWYARLMAPQLNLDATLHQIVSTLIDGKTSDEEKIRAIHHFVLRNTHYVALEFGIFNYKPYPVSDIYARRFGDCKDKSSLMIALLRAAGIDADLALVRTRRLGDVSPDATSVSVFNHAVVYIPKYDLWLDGTAEYAGAHEVPIEDQGAQALTVAMDGSAQFRRIPTTLPMENYTHRQVRAEVQPDGRIEFTGSAYTRGEDAPGLRREYEVTEQQRTSFRNNLAEVLPSVRLNTVEVNGAHDLESDVVVNFSGDLDTYNGAHFVSLRPSWMKRSYVQTLAPLVSRTEELQLPAPWTTEEELHFEIPHAAKIISLPHNTSLDTPFGSAVVQYERQGDQIVVKTSVQFSKVNISVSEYAAFRDFCSQVDSAFRQKIRVEL